MRRRPDDRAVSDVVSFVLIFSLMIVSVGVVATTGIGVLQDYRDAEQVNSAEQVMTLVGTSVDEVAAGGSPRRSNEIDLRGGSIAVREGPDVTVTVGGTTYPSGTTETGSLVYSYSGTPDSQFVYSSGHLLRQDGDAAIPLDSPRFVCGDDAATVRIVRIRTVGTASVGGGRVSIETTRNGTDVLYPSGSTGGSPVELDVSTGVTTRDDAWRESLTRSASGWTHAGGTTYECPSANRVTVTRTNVTIRFVT